MKRLRLLAAGLLILPLAAWAAAGHEAPQSVVGVKSARSEQSLVRAMPVPNRTDYHCCWAWIDGQWWCIVC